MSRDLPGTCLSPEPVILSCFQPGTKAVAGDTSPSPCGPWGVLSHLPVHGSKRLLCGSGLDLAQGGPGLAVGQGWKGNLLRSLVPCFLWDMSVSEGSVLCSPKEDGGGCWSSSGFICRACPETLWVTFSKLVAFRQPRLPYFNLQNFYKAAPLRDLHPHLRSCL